MAKRSNRAPVTIEDNGSHLEIRKGGPGFEWAIILVFVPLICGWCYAEYSIVSSVLLSSTSTGIPGPSAPVFPVWMLALYFLLGYTFGGLAFIVIFLWFGRGQETVRVSSARLTISRSIFGLGPSRSYDTASIHSMRLKPPSLGMICFDCNDRMIGFGAFLDKSEAKTVLDSILAKYPELSEGAKVTGIQPEQSGGFGSGLSRRFHSRSTVRDFGSYLEIRVPGSGFGFLTPVIATFAVGSTYFLVLFLISVLSHGLGAGSTFSSTVLFAFAFVGVIFTITWLTVLWQCFGWEILRVSETSLVIARSIFGVGSKREFNLSEIKRLRASQPLMPGSKHVSKGSSYGTIAFDYGARTYRFGADVDEAEGRRIVETIFAKYPGLGANQPFRATTKSDSNDLGSRRISPALPRATVLDPGPYLEVRIPPNGLRSKAVPMAAFVVFPGIFACVSGEDLWFRFAHRTVTGWAAVGPVKGASPGTDFFLMIAGVIAPAFAFRALLWKLWGQQIVRVGPQHITLENRLFGRSKVREFALEDVTEPLAVSSSYPSTGSINIKTGKRTVSFGMGLNPAECDQILEVIAAKFPEWKASHSRISPD